MKKIWCSKWFCAAVAALLLLSILPAQVALGNVDAQYIDEYDNVQTAPTVTVIDNNSAFSSPLSGWYLVRGTLTVSNPTITIGGDVHLILENGCDVTVNGADGNAGINVTGDNKLTIYEQPQGQGTTVGKLKATGGGGGAGGGAGIGGGNGQTVGTITINGGTIEAKGGGGGSSGAGIGGGYKGAGGTIIINRGTVTANGGDGGSSGAGIGGGANGEGGTITINNGEIKATGRGGGAGIGGGNGGDGGSITISGSAIVEATGKKNGAGIGGGNGGDGGSIEISGGSVTATAGDSAAGIGGGANGGSGTINITCSLAQVTAKGGNKGSPYDAGAKIGTGGGMNNKPGYEYVWIKEQPRSIAAYIGSKAQFAVMGGTYTLDSLTYQWQRWDGADWEDIKDEADSQLTINPVSSADLGEYRCMVGGYVPSNEAKLTLRQPVPLRPAIGDDAVFTGTIAGGARIEVPFIGAPSGMAVELSAGGQTYAGTVDGDGVALFEIPAGALEPGTYPLRIQSPGGSPLQPTPIGKLIMQYQPAVSGANALTVLPGAPIPLGFVVQLTGSDPENPTRLTLSVGGASATLDQRGNGTAQFSLTLDPAATGTIPVIASAPATATSEAIPDTAVGSVAVLDASAHLSGDLQGKLGAGWLFGRAGANVPIAFQGDGALLDEGTGALSIENKDALRVAINYLAPGKLTGALSKLRQSPFAAPKAAQPVPAQLELKAEAKISKSLKAARFSFAAQDMARLEPGEYRFTIQAAPSGKFKGFGPLTLATIRITDGTATPTEWTMPSALRVSVGQQYQLVKPIPSDGALPTLTTATSNKKIATLNGDGVLTAKKSGTATIKARAADGSVLKCKLTVVPNRFSRAKPLYIKGKPGIYTSTRRLYYEQGALKAEVFVSNLSGQVIYGANAWVFELYDGERLVHRQPIPPVTFKNPLKHKKYATYKLTLTDAQIPGISQKSLDLGSKRFQAVIRGDGAIPVTPSTQGAAQAKSIGLLAH